MGFLKDATLIINVNSIETKREPKLPCVFFNARLLVHDVHCHFKAKTHFSRCWCCPHDHFL